MADVEKPVGTWRKYETYSLNVDPAQGDRATELKILSFARPHMRAFHLAWFSFFMAFLTWFSFAPLMPEVKDDLELSDDQVYNANISSVASTVTARFIVGPLCDTFGARYMSAFLLIGPAVPAYFSGLVNSAVDLAVVRFFVGIMGAVFVATQSWCSQMFAKEVVGTANAISGGWGNLGGGVTQLFMVGLWNGFRTSMSDESAWRISFVVPATMCICVAFLTLSVADDCPKGNFKDLIREGSMQRKSSKASAKVAWSNLNSWIMFVQYATCFGIELTINNTASSYFKDDFNLTTSEAGVIASLFGLMNIFARAWGGMFSDFLNTKFGGGQTGMRGRLIAQAICLLGEGLMLITFSQQRKLENAIVVLVFFSLFTQAAEGSSFGIVPYISPDNTGAVSGIVGAGGNTGAVMWGLIFRFGPSSKADVYEILGYIVVASVALVPMVKIRGYATIFQAPQGEPENLDVI